MERNWRWLWICLVIVLLFGVAALSNTIDSATMVFEGSLTANGDGSFTGIVIMVDGNGEIAASAGDGVAGFDVYARNGAMATYDKAGGGSQDYACGRVVDHDAYTTAGGWGSYYNPDCADWYNYQLRFENGNWYLEYNANVGNDGDTSGAAAAPMSGVMDWTNMYALETGAGAYYSGMGNAETPGYALDNSCTGVNSGEAAWDMDWSWGSEYIPLAFPGYEVTITDLGSGKYRVILAPADGRQYGVNSPGPVVNETTGESYGTIQAAIDDAQPGDTILVAAGTYDEQVVIDKSLTLQGVGDTTIIKPSQTTANNFQLFSRKASANLPTAAIIVVDQAEAESVTIENLKVDGSNVSSVSTDASMFVGILWRGTGGTIDSVIVEDIGIKNGNAIYITSYGKTVTTEVKNCVISSYLKNGITANHEGLTANIHHNTVTGMGPTGDIAQNGIQVGFGATGTVENNIVSENAWIYPGTGTHWQASGILFWNSGGTATGNTVTNCQGGIMAQAGSGSHTVTIEGNTVSAAGLGGTGVIDVVGINAATWDAGASIDVTIKDNDLASSGPGNGIEIGSLAEYGAAGTVNATIEGNKVSGWWHGIWLGIASNEVTITGNTITNNVAADSGVHIISGVDVSNMAVNFNNIEGNVDHGVYNGGTGTLDAKNNWWGDDSGPSGVGPGTGDAVSDNVDFEPWVRSEVTESATEELDEGDTVSLPSGDASVTATGGSGTVTVAKYADNPTGTGFGTNEVGYIDVYVPDPSGLTELEIRLYYPDTIAGADENTLQLFWWDVGNASWVPCSDQGVNTADTDGYGGYIWAVIGTNTTPNLGQLGGAIFGGGGGLPASVFWYEDFEYADQAAMEAAGWSFSGNSENLWHLASEADVPSLAYDNLTPFPSPDHAVWFGRDDTGSYALNGLGPSALSPEARARAARMRPMGAGGGYPYGELTSPQIELPAGVSAVRVGFGFYREVECYSQGSYDRTYVQVSFDGGQTWQTVWSRDSTECWLQKVWHPMYVDGIPVWGEDNWALVAVPAGATTMRIRFVFDAVDNVANDFLGWLIDDLLVATAGGDQLRIEPQSLPEGIVGQYYEATLYAVGGTAEHAYSWRIIEKPDWLNTNIQDDSVTVSGTPTAPGTYQLCIGVSDDRGQTYERCYDIVIEQAIVGGVLFYDDFEGNPQGNFAGDWDAPDDSLWHLTDGSAWPSVWVKPEPPYASPTHCYYYGKDETLNYATAGANSGCLVSPAIDVSGLTAGTQLTIGWKYWRQVEFYQGEYDKTYVEISFDGTNWSTIWYKDSKDPSEQDWQLVEVSAYPDGSPIVVPAGATVLRIRFCFDTVDGYANQYIGWLIDDVKVILQEAPPEQLQITTECADLPDGQVGQPYYADLEATGGVLPYHWSWYCGNGGIPGLDLDQLTGEITGTPTQAGEFCCTFTVTDAAGNQDTLYCCIDIAAAPPCPCDLLDEDFEDATGWNMTGLWHVPADLECIDCNKLGGKYAYFGQDDTCDYATGARVQGYLTSPVIQIPECVDKIAVGFSHFREVESYNGAFDKTFVQISWDGGPWQTIWYRDSKDPSPDCEDMVISLIPVEGTQLQVRFGFDSVDKLYNNYVGWAIDNVWVKNADCVGDLGPAMLPLAVEPESRPREPSFLAVPNPVRDVHTTTFYVRGVEADLIRVEVYDFSGRLVYRGEAPGNELVWHTEDLDGLPLANGVYLYKAYAKVGEDWIVSDVLKIVILR